MDVIKALWLGTDPKQLSCCHCQKTIEPGEVLARTFTIDSTGYQREVVPTAKFEVPTLSETLLTFHRHLDCLLDSTSFVAISHVWHPEVSKLESKADLRAQETTVAAIEALEEPTQICKALAAIGERVEVWHDYISVPQWQDDIKTDMIQEIPRIYSRAKFVTILLSDTDAGSVKLMRGGTSSDEVARGVSNICNAKYWSRIWTAMEYTQARNERVLLKDYTWVDNLPNYTSIVNEMWGRWNVEVRKHGSPLIVEAAVGMGYNLVPWQLGPLEHLRNRGLHHWPTIFATAYELLSRRNITREKDFFYAFVGILKPDFQLTKLDFSNSSKAALMRIARDCIQHGDYSPLLMIPASSLREPDEVILQQYGYLDSLTFGLGIERAGPTYRDVTFDLGNPIIRAEKIGVIVSVRKEPHDLEKLWLSFSIDLRLALDSTGLDINAFVDTLGSRLYGLPSDKLNQRLSQQDRVLRLQKLIQLIYDEYPKRLPDREREIAEIMGMSNCSIKGNGVSPMSNLVGYTGSLHLGRAMALVSVKCNICHQVFLLRVALLKHASQILGTMAYRIPGLQYSPETLAGGMGVLLKNHRIVGRFIWGTPTCTCDKTKRVKVHLDDVSMPQPNQYVYGSRKVPKGTWMPLHMHDQIRL